MVKAVVFDIGNVLISWNPLGVYDRLIGAPRRRAFFEQVPVFDYNKELDRGESLDAVVQAMISDYPQWADECRMWRDHWADMVEPEIPHSVRLLRALRTRGIPVFALSNFGRDTFDIAAQRYPFLLEFDHAYISGRMGLIKPDDDIYAALETDSGLQGADLLFADDLADNIATARDRGWHTHLFETPQGWADCLINHGLLTSDEAA